jgi:hypothetical protein
MKVLMTILHDPGHSNPSTWRHGQLNSEIFISHHPGHKFHTFQKNFSEGGTSFWWWPGNKIIAMTEKLSTSFSIESLLSAKDSNFKESSKLSDLCDRVCHVPRDVSNGKPTGNLALKSKFTRHLTMHTILFVCGVVFVSRNISCK